MSLENLKQQIARYAAISGPVGFEEPVLEAARAELDACCDRVEVDVRGNVYGYLDGTDPNAPLVMITAHADEIGFMVTSILPDGFLRFAKLGGPTDSVLPGQRVRVLSETGELEGVIGVKPGHVLRDSTEARQVPEVSKMYIDVGARTDEEAAEWGIEPGTPAVFVGEFTETRNANRCFGKTIDNRMGVVCCLEVARALADNKPSANVAIAIVVEEEIGLRGAAVAATHLNPDVVIAIDTVPAGGTPDLNADELPWSIGGGPLLKVRETKGLSTHGPLRNLIRDAAEESEIDYQLIVDTAGMTDATTAQQAGGQVAAAVVGLARRYSHSAVEMFDVSDVAGIIELVTAATRKISSKEQLLRI